MADEKLNILTLAMAKKYTDNSLAGAGGSLGDKYFCTAPIGVIQAFSGNTVPYGYLLADGASYKVADYPDLYAVIGNTYGGDTENFNVPDYRETVLVGVGENTTDTIASHDVYGLGEFKDDQLQRIQGTYTTGAIYNESYGIGPNTYDGAFTFAIEGEYSKYAVSQVVGGGGGGIGVRLDSARTTRTGDTNTTHGKQKGVTYIIKAFHTNEGVDSKNEVSDPIIENVEGEIAKVDTELKGSIEEFSSALDELENITRLTDFDEAIPEKGKNKIYYVNKVLGTYKCAQWRVESMYYDVSGAKQYRGVQKATSINGVDNIMLMREYYLDNNVMHWGAWKELATMDKVVNSIIRESKSTLYNLNNVDNIEVAIDITKSGYKPIAVSLYNSGTNMWFAQGIYFNDKVCNLSLRGVTPTSTTNAECEVLVTYIKTS